MKVSAELSKDETFAFTNSGQGIFLASSNTSAIKIKTEVKMRLLYVMDPMCAWCYGFEPELEEFLKKHSSLEVDFIMGGLAPDTHYPMDEKLKQSISSYWYEIEKTARVTFNHDFWKLNTPYRSTYSACRAVIAAEYLKEKSAHQMVKSIQSAYYLEAKNPSLEKTLIACACSIGLDKNQFLEAFKSEKIEQRFQEHLRLTYELKARAFPALFYINNRNETYPLTLSYTQTSNLEQRFNHIKGK